MAEEPGKRGSPHGLWPEVKSIILLGINYGMAGDPMAPLAEPDKGTIALYARRKDYHETIKGRLKELAGYLKAKAGGEVKVFVDTAPVMEKPLAAAAGLGWQGKNTLLVSRDFGSWLVLGAIYTTLELPVNAAQHDLCGSCTKCLDICPTAAFPQPYVLDARRCISYLTIEHPGVIAREFREPIGNRIFGCDDCLAVCPWNKFATASHDMKLGLREDLMAPDLAALAKLDDAEFRKLFAGTPIKRTGRDRFVRNVLIAIGNSGDAALAQSAIALLGDTSPLVRGMAVWALSRLLAGPAFTGLAAQRAASENEETVCAEWRLALEKSCA